MSEARKSQVNQVRNAWAADAEVYRVRIAALESSLREARAQGFVDAINEFKLSMVQGAKWQEAIGALMLHASALSPAPAAKECDTECDGSCSRAAALAPQGKENP